MNPNISEAKRTKKTSSNFRYLNIKIFFFFIDFGNYSSRENLDYMNPKISEAKTNKQKIHVGT